LFGKGIHLTIEDGKAVSDNTKVILVAFDPFRCPFERRLFNHVPNSIDEVKGVVGRVGDIALTKDSQGGFIVTADMNGALVDVKVLTEDITKNDDAKDGKFSPVGVTFLDWTWYSMNCFDLALICRTYQGECSSNSREFECEASVTPEQVCAWIHWAMCSNPSGQSTKSRAHLRVGSSWLMRSRTECGCGIGAGGCTVPVKSRRQRCPETLTVALIADWGRVSS
jgi:hypothetical protein